VLVTHESGVKYLGLGVLTLLDGIFWYAFVVVIESEKTIVLFNIIKQIYERLVYCYIVLMTYLHSMVREESYLLSSLNDTLFPTQLHLDLYILVENFLI
jgi:hypothetical protein